MTISKLSIKYTNENIFIILSLDFIRVLSIIIGDLEAGFSRPDWLFDWQRLSVYLSVFPAVPHLAPSSQMPRSFSLFEIFSIIFFRNYAEE